MFDRLLSLLQQLWRHHERKSDERWSVLFVNRSVILESIAWLAYAKGYQLAPTLRLSLRNCYKTLTQWKHHLVAAQMISVCGRPRQVFSYQLALLCKHHSSESAAYLVLVRVGRSTAAAEGLRYIMGKQGSWRREHTHNETVDATRSAKSE